jgi:hypothetical protein
VIRPRSDPAGDGAVGFGATALSGVLLGCAICLLEVVEQPLSNVGVATIRDFLSPIAPLWCAQALGWALVARWAEPKWSVTGLVVVCVAAALALTVVANPFDGGGPIYNHGRGLRNDARFIHTLWINLFYGSLYFTGCVASRRAVRSRRVLARVRQAREESAALLEQTRLDAMRRQLQPQTLLDALDALRQRYGRDRAGADDLVDELVGFLRPAVRSLVGDTATLAGELELARRYLQLRALIGDGDIEAAPPHPQPPPATPFPPRLLMPLVESLCLSGAWPRLTGAWRGDDYRVVLTSEGVPPAALPASLRQRIADAAGQWGPAFKSEFVEDGNHLSWTLTVVRARRTQMMEMHA